MKKIFLFTAFLIPLMVKGQSFIIFEQKLEINEERNSNISNHVVLMPNTIPGRQKLIDIEFTTKPDLIIQNNEDYFLEYNAETLKTLDEIVVSSNLILSRNDWNTAKQRAQPIESNQDLEPYLKAEWSIKSDLKRIKDLAKDLLAENSEKTLRNIFDYVVGTLEYDRLSRESRGALHALRTGKGIPIDYADLMIALCRANKIPARFVNGYLVNTDFFNWQHHIWVEVYFDKHGWVAFDPALADAINAQTTFDKMLNKYIIMSFTRFPRSGWRKSSYSSMLKYSNRVVNLLDEEITEIQRLYHANKLDESRYKVDSLLNAGLTDHKLFLHKSMISLSEKKLDEALSNLQGALKYAYFERDKLPVYIKFAAYYALVGDKVSAIEALHKTFDNENVATGNDLKFLTRKDYFKSIQNEPYYKKLISKLKVSDLNSHFSITDYDILIPNWTEFLSPDCSSNNNLIYVLPFDISQDQILKGKVKSMNATSNKITSEYNFNSKGLLNYYRNCSKPSKNTTKTWLKYDNNDKLIEKQTVSIIDDKDTLRSYIMYYDFTQNCLSSVRVFDNSTKVIDTLLICEVHSNYIYIESFENKFFGLRAKKNKLFHNSKGLRERLVTYNERDTFLVEWIYDEANRKTTRFVDDNEQICEEFNQQKQLIKSKTDKTIEEKIYDKSGRLISKSQERSGISIFYKYKYNKKGLPKAEYYKVREGKFKKENDYKYEYF